MSANRDISNIRLLIRGDIDLWVSSDFTLPSQLQQAGVDSGELERVYTFPHAENDIAFSLETPQGVVQGWQQCLDALKADGTDERLAHQYHLNPESWRDSA